MTAMDGSGQPGLPGMTAVDLTGPTGLDDVRLGHGPGWRAMSG